MGGVSPLSYLFPVVRIDRRKIYVVSDETINIGNVYILSFPKSDKFNSTPFS